MRINYRYFFFFFFFLSRRRRKITVVVRGRVPFVSESYAACSSETTPFSMPKLCAATLNERVLWRPSVITDDIPAGRVPPPGPKRDGTAIIDFAGLSLRVCALWPGEKTRIKNLNHAGTVRPCRHRRPCRRRRPYQCSNDPQCDPFDDYNTDAFHAQKCMYGYHFRRARTTSTKYTHAVKFLRVIGRHLPRVVHPGQLCNHCEIFFPTHDAFDVFKSHASSALFQIK